jgi:ferrous iron transport protein A
MLIRLNLNKLISVIAERHSGQQLIDLPLGQEAKIAHFTNDLIGSKLMTMGVLPGSSLQILRKSPFGGSWYVKVGNFYLALRKVEAESIVLA